MPPLPKLPPFRYHQGSYSEKTRKGMLSMLGRTHVSIGLATLTYAIPGFALPSLQSDKALLAFGMTIMATVVGSLAPDLDQPGSTLARDVAGPFGKSRLMAMLGGAAAIFINQYFHINQYLTLAGIILLVMAFIKHRGITHSLLGILAAAYAVYALQGWEVYRHFVGVPIIKPFMIGYIAHIAADFFAGGIMFGYPVFKKNVKVPLITIHTGSLMDKVIVNYAAFLLAVVNVLKISPLILHLL